MTRSKRPKTNNQISTNVSSHNVIKVDENIENSAIPNTENETDSNNKSFISELPSSKKSSTFASSTKSSTAKEVTTHRKPLSSVKHVKADEDAKTKQVTGNPNDIQEKMFPGVKVRIIPPTTVKASTRKRSSGHKKKADKYETKEINENKENNSNIANNESSSRVTSRRTSMVTRKSTRSPKSTTQKVKVDKSQVDSITIFEAKLEEALRQGTTGVIGQSGGGLRNSPAEPEKPHSQWSPIRKKVPMTLEEASIRCTKSSSVKNRRDE